MLINFEGYLQGFSSLNPQSFRLVSLLSLGINGAYSKLLGQEFLTLGILHVLVVSGAQMAIFSHTLRFIFWKLIAPVRCSLKLKIIVQKIFLIFVFILYLQNLNFDPPICRAILIISLSVLFVGKKKSLIFLCGFFIHLILWTKHAFGISFYLSWFSSFLVFYLSSFDLPEILKKLFIIISCQIFAIFVFGTNGIGVGQFLLIVIMNLFLLNCIEKLLIKPLFVILAFFIVFRLIGMESIIIWVSQKLMSSYFSNLSDLILVVIKGIRYNFLI